MEDRTVLVKRWLERTILRPARNLRIRRDRDRIASLVRPVLAPADLMPVILEASRREGRDWDAHDPQDEESPIFLLATGWKTGSTLLQRICMTDRSLLMYGEPLGRLSLIPRLTAALHGLSAGFPRDENLLGRVGEEDLVTGFPANLAPGVPDLRRGMRALLTSWLAEPARRMGYRRWGLKEVRLGAGEAILLRWLFPNARFAVLTRHPHAVYASSEPWNYWYRWPDLPAHGGMGVVRHWNDVASTWAEVPAGLDPMTIRYEDLAEPDHSFSELEAHLGIVTAPAEALNHRTGSTPNQRAVRWTVARSINRVARSGMKAMGYT